MLSDLPPGQHAQHDATARITDFFETLTPDSLNRFGEFYTPNAFFKDPFNEVRGVAELRGIFVHMYEALDKPRFIVTDSVTQGEQCFLCWNFEFYFRNFDKTTLQTIRGTSHLKFTEQGLVDFHRDYWDVAEELYEKLPWVGGLMRWLKKRARP
ncbi:MAG: nuclear transport factor 2 family protein [Pseudomonadota bacterium]